MDNMNEKIESRLKEIINELDVSEMPSIDECKAIRNELNNLKAFRENKIQEKTMGYSIDELLSKFWKVADGSKEILNEAINSITSGRVPDVSVIDEMNMRIELLSDSYDAIWSLANRELSFEERPESNAPVDEIREALKNSKAAIRKAELKEIKKILGMFIEIKSIAEMYSNALQPFQEKAKCLLEKLDNEKLSVDEAKEESENAALFMQAFECESIEDTKGVDLFAEVYEKISPTVQIGLIRKMYTLDTNEEIKDVNKPIEGTNEVTDDDDAKEKTGSTAEDTEPVKTEIKVKNTGKIEDAEDGEDGESDEAIEATMEVSEFVEALKEKSLILKDNSCFASLRTVKSMNEEKKLSATIFSNEIRTGDEKAAIHIIKIICKETPIPKNALAMMSGMPPQLLENTIGMLFNKGYIRKCYMDNVAIVVPSPRLKSALTFETVSKKIGVKKNFLADYNQLTEEDENVVAASISEANVIETICEKHFGKDEKSLGKIEVSRSHIGAASFISLVKFNHCLKRNLVLGEFWNNVDDCDDFFRALDDELNSGSCMDGLESITFAAFNLEMARDFAEVLNDRLNLNLYTTKFNYYGLNKNNFEEGSQPSKVEDENDIKLNDNVNSIYEGEEDDKKTEESESTKLNNHQLMTEVLEPDTYGVEEMLADGIFSAATAYAKAEAMENPSKEVLYKQLMYAFNAPSEAEDNKKYSASNLYGLIINNSKVENSLVVASAFRTFFSNQVQYDYDIKPAYDALNDYDILNDVPGLKQALYDISEFKHTYKKGLDFYADCHKRDQRELELEVSKVQSEAKEFYEKNVVGIIKETTTHKRYLETIKLVFSPSNDIGQCLKFIVDGDKDAKAIVEDFLKNNFFTQESDITEDNIDEAMLWEYIQEYWNEAGLMMSFQKRDDLKSHLRSNVMSRTNKAVQILTKWVRLIESQKEHTLDDGEIAYKKVKKKVQDNIETAIKSIETKVSKNPNLRDELACMRVLEYTLKEIAAALDGTFDEGTKQFFYADFLLTDEIMLDERYMPDFDVHSSNIETLSAQNRILAHIDKLKRKKEKGANFEKQLQDIMDGNDNYGAAKLIIGYLSTKDSNFDTDYYRAEIGDSIDYAKETAEIRKADFVGELELAQSYGQIDNSNESPKEVILRAIDEWFEWACLSENYGFFKKVVDSYMTDIRRNAKKREEEILGQLDEYRSSNDSKVSVDAKQKKISKILAAINEQNYTVAEDLLSRDDADDSVAEALIEEDFLRDLLENYDDFYRPVASKTASLANLIRNRIRNKEDRGAKRLAESWLPGGSKIGKLQLEKLLSALGFEVEEISEQKTLGRFEEYRITTVGAFKRQRNSYTHPIAAFGSGAAESGFRVVCLNGAYDADKLIDIMKQIGDAKNALILLDCALTLGERRRLARKTKTSLGDKLFAVLDRTVMMYLIRNYDETKINRMFVALVTPFAYYQPYVWESVNIMPPEIFMGRKIELEKIKSPTGVNIVYGGRQLGKSALLKKAKEDIDWNENGDRAVYIDIKGLNYTETAQKVCYELIDQFILDESCETDDWGELSRAIKKRLQNNEKKIPYLLLLLDEADAFIESCGTVNYKPFDALKEVQSVGIGRFKFVVAGLRNIVRFKRDALANNSVLTHLEPLTVTPFKFSEARELMEVPLHYLGFRFPKEKESLVTLIMATTNYFPGLIQLYCAKLIDAMRNHDYAGYDEADSPIYEVNEEHIKKVLADPEFMQQIREKFIITLRLDEDNQYYLIALLIAWLYYNDNQQEKKTGYSAEDIKNIAETLEISKFAKIDANRIENLCEELRELNVLRKASEHSFMFTRLTFLQMMGTADEIDDALFEYIEAGEKNE